MVVGKELHAFHFTKKNIIECRCMIDGLDINIVGNRDVILAIVLESCESKLNNVEVVGGLFYPLVEFHIVGEHALNALELCHQPRELTVKGHKVGLFDVIDERGQHLLEVCSVYLHKILSLPLSTKPISFILSQYHSSCHSIVSYSSHIYQYGTNYRPFSNSIGRVIQALSLFSTDQLIYPYIIFIVVVTT
jgi:hypothetical protein